MLRSADVVLFEREHELGRLDALVADVLDGQGRLVVLEGPPGIGKTRLLDAARARARERELVVLSARASELDRDFPLGVVRQLFEPLLQGAGPEGRAALLHGAAGPAAALLGIGAPGATAPGDDPSPAHFHALYWLTANLAAQAPLALVLDDVHWADSVSLRFLQFLAPRLEELPVLLALAARPGEAPPDLDAVAADPSAIVLRPAPLSDEAVAALIARELGEVAEPAFGPACRAATGGNPFLLRELLHALAEEGEASVPLVEQVAPATVARAVLLRLGRLGEEATALARAVAVLGDGAPLRRAAALTGLEDDQADEHAAALARADILAPVRPLAFAHPILRAAVYADLDAGERARAHRRAAALLAADGADASAVAVHLLSTEPAGDPEVVAALRDASRQAVSRGAFATAVACLRRAADEPPAEAERGPILLDLAAAELRAGDPTAAAARFDEGVRLTSDPRSRAAYAREQGVALLAVGRRDEAIALLEQAVAEAETADRDLALSLEASLIGTARLDRSRLPWLRARLDRYRGRLTGATPGERVLLATQVHLDAFSRHSSASADELADAAERALGDGQLIADASGPSPPYCFATDVLMLADRLDAARRALARVVDDARRRGSAPWFWFASGMRCGLLAREGDLRSAEADGRSVAELSLHQGWFLALPNMLGSLTAVLVDRGELDEAEKLLERSGYLDHADTERLAAERVVHARARLRFAQRDLEGGRADLDWLGPPRARWNTYPTLVPPVLIAPELADESRERVERMRREAETWGTPRAIGMALRAAGLVAQGPERLELLAEAVAVLEDSPAPLEHAHALADLGASLRRANRRAASRDPLRRALDIADDCGATPLAERARAELRAAGGRPRRARITGPGALTASERRIAAMAVDGLSNPEIAQALFVTTKTVETHLSSAYRKLDIRSRGELAAALEG